RTDTGEISPSAAFPAVGRGAVWQVANASRTGLVFSPISAGAVLTSSRAGDAAAHSSFSGGDVQGAVVGTSNPGAAALSSFFSSTPPVLAEAAPRLEVLAAMGGSTRGPSGPTINFEPIASGLDRPVAITHANDGSGRLFITLQRGQIRIYDG